MLVVARRLADHRVADVQLVLPFALRQKSRFRTCTGTGEEVAVTLGRGGTLRGGDQLLADDGRVVDIVAAVETVTTVRSDVPRSLARAAYHLGNRHVELQVGEGWLRYLHDHVLDDMVRGLGLSVNVESAPFEPEAGAYGAGSRLLLAHHSHGHDH